MNKAERAGAECPGSFLVCGGTSGVVETSEVSKKTSGVVERPRRPLRSRGYCLRVSDPRGRVC